MSVSLDTLNAYVATQKPYKPLTAFTDADREESLADFEAADNAPENVWATIISGGKVVAEIYKSAAYATFGGASLTIDANASPEEKARLLAGRLGGALQ